MVGWEDYAVGEGQVCVPQTFDFGKFTLSIGLRFLTPEFSGVRNDTHRNEENYSFLETPPETIYFMASVPLILISLTLFTGTIK